MDNSLTDNTLLRIETGKQKFDMSYVMCKTETTLRIPCPLNTTTYLTLYVFQHYN